jgi:acyl carrier protein phosphodiesterase
MHQRVDAFSDSHAAFARSRRRFQPPHRRYAGVLVDLVYDHFLAAHWEDYSPEPLSDFTRRAYAVLASREAILPARLQGMLPRMIADDWLSAYRDLDNVGRALRGISHRLRRANPLGDSLAALRANYAGLEKDFHEFFPELAAFSADIVAASIHDNGKHVSRGANFRG